MTPLPPSPFISEEPTPAALETVAAPERIIEPDMDALFVAIITDDALWNAIQDVER